MYYIYCYTNKINQHKYIGQTNNYKRRNREHKSCSFNVASPTYNDLFHYKVREYGWENFDFELLETLYTDDIREVNLREQYWIEKKESFCETGKGYNKDYGGNNFNHSTALTQEEIEDVKEMIKQGAPYFDIQEKYQISPTFISNINYGLFFAKEDEEYPLYKHYKSDEDYDELIDLLLNSPLSLAEIAKKLGMGYSTVKKINAGTLRKGLYPTYPIRAKTPNEIRADKIKDLLLNTNYSNVEIAQMTKTSNETVRRINKGETFKDKKLTYPLRKPVTTIS